MFHKGVIGKREDGAEAAKGRRKVVKVVNKQLSDIYI